MKNLPWQPLFTVERSGEPEQTVYGIISAVHIPAGAHKVEGLIAHGDVDRPLWSRSLLKPWQLASHLEEIETAYPGLTDEQVAIMMASHQGEDLHLKLVHELLKMSGISEEALKCPASYPTSSSAKTKIKSQNLPAKSIYHNCSGKHTSYLMATKAEGEALDTYLKVDSAQQDRLRRLLSKLLGRSADSFAVTTDGCQLPNYALSAHELATLYLQLIGNCLVPEGLDKTIKRLGQLMHNHPRVIGGETSLDNQVASGLLSNAKAPQMVAKVGADGLLAIGFGPGTMCGRPTNGGGLVIKLSSGFDERHFQPIVKYVFELLGFGKPDQDKSDANQAPHISTCFHFSLAPVSEGIKS